jgi:hypothetical protein
MQSTVIQQCPADSDTVPESRSIISILLSLEHIG